MFICGSSRMASCAESLLQSSHNASPYVRYYTLEFFDSSDIFFLVLPLESSVEIAVNESAASGEQGSRKDTNVSSLIACTAVLENRKCQSSARGTHCSKIRYLHIIFFTFSMDCLQIVQDFTSFGLLSEHLAKRRERFSFFGRPRTYGSVFDVAVAFLFVVSTKG